MSLPPQRVEPTAGSHARPRRSHPARRCPWRRSPGVYGMHMEVASDAVPVVND